MAIENSEVAETFNIRNIAQNILLFANLGAVQLNCTYGIEQCFQVVELLQADAFIF